MYKEGKTLSPQIEIYSETFTAGETKTINSDFPLLGFLFLELTGDFYVSNDGSTPVDGTHGAYNLVDMENLKEFPGTAEAGDMLLKVDSAQTVKLMLYKDNGK